MNDGSKGAAAPKPYELPLDRRLNRVQRIYVRNDAIKEAWGVLNHSHDYSLRLRETEACYIIGNSRCGKSETVKRFIHERTGKHVIEDQFIQIIEGKDKHGKETKIFYADMTNGATPLVATQEIVGEIFGDLKAGRLKEAQAAPRLAKWFKDEGVKMFIIDEAQQLFNGQGPDGPLKLAKWLLALENSRSFAICLVGAPELQLLLKHMNAANERKGAIGRLAPFDFKTAEDKRGFRKFVELFAVDLPFLSSCILDENGHCNDSMLFALFYATRGRPGALAKLSEHATIKAFEDPKTKGSPVALELEHYAAAFDLLLKYDHRMNKKNPFRVKDTKSLPAIDLSLFDEEQRAFRLRAEAKKRSGKSPGIYIYGDV
jgi:hypothetical protein